MESFQNNTKKFLFYRVFNCFYQRKIVEIIETDEDWLGELGIINIEEQNSNNIKDLIRSKLVLAFNLKYEKRFIQFVLNLNSLK